MPRVILGLLLVLLWVPAAWPATYYTSATGNDGNPCPSAQIPTTPKATIAGGIGCLSSCDTLIVKPGTYNEIIADTIQNGNASTGCMTTVKAETAGTVILKPDDTWPRPSGVGIVTFGEVDHARHHVTLDGFVLDADLIRSGVYVVYFKSPDAGYDVNNITVSNNEIRYTPNINAGTAGDGLVPGVTARNLIVRGNYIHDIGACNQAQVSHGDCTTLRAMPCPGGSCQDFYGYGMYWTAKDSLIENNEITRAAGFGIHMYNNYTAAADNNIFRGNKIHHNQGLGFLFSAGGHNNQAYNNLLYNNGLIGSSAGNIGNQGLAVGGAQYAQNTLVANNTLYGNFGTCITVRTADNTTVRNNICYSNGGDVVDQTGAGTGNVADHNVLGTNPLFVNAGAGDFRLQVGSPAIDAGTTVAQVTTDITGIPRTAPYDIGAYEVGVALPSQMIARWKLDEGTGTTAADATGNAHTATLTAAPSWGPGRTARKALTLNGTTQYGTASGLMGNSPIVSLAAWFQLPVAPPAGRGEVLSLGDVVAIQVSSTRIVGHWYGGSGAWNEASWNTTALFANVWHHAVFVANPAAGVALLYIDGVQRASNTTTGSINYSELGTDTQLGRNGAVTSHYFPGQLQDLRVYNFALTPSDVQYLYNSTAGSMRRRGSGLLR